MAEPTELGAPIGSGKEAEVFAYGAGVLKLTRAPGPKSAPFREAAVLAMVEAAGLPAPVVTAVGQFGARWGLVMSRAPGPTFAEAMRDAARMPAVLRAMAALHRRIHSKAGAGAPDLKSRLAANIARAEAVGPRRAGLVAGLEGMPEGDRLCHGDFHPWNILGPLDRPVVIDWLDACRGAPAADLCRSWVLMRPAMPEAADAYVAAYAGAAGIGVGAVAAWLPYVAAARLAEGVEEPGLMRMVAGEDGFA